MEALHAITALAALAQESRLAIFRLLVQAGADGLAVGHIGHRLNLPSATLSFHLSQLRQAGLVSCRRNGRSITYTAEYPSMTALIGFLTENCCAGDAAACGFGISATGEAASEPPSEGEFIMDETAEMVIYHNPECGTSRNVLGLIRGAGFEPHVIEYLKTPPSRSMLVSLIRRMGAPVRSVIREKGTPYHDLGLDNPDLTDDELIDAMIEHPILINRPIVVTPLGVKLCRPSETVRDILPAPQRGESWKENGEVVSPASGQAAR